MEIAIPDKKEIEELLKNFVPPVIIPPTDDYREKLFQELLYVVDTYIQPTRDMLSRGVALSDEILTQYLATLAEIRKRLLNLILDNIEVPLASLTIQAHESVILTIDWSTGLSKDANHKPTADVLENKDVSFLKQRVTMSHAKLKKQRAQENQNQNQNQLQVQPSYDDGNNNYNDDGTNNYNDDGANNYNENADYNYDANNDPNNYDNPDYNANYNDNYAN